MLLEDIYLMAMQFFCGIKDSIYGIMLIYSLDCKIQQQKSEKYKKIRETRTAFNQQHASRRSQGAVVPKSTPEPRMLGRVFLSAALGSFVWISVWLFSMYLIPAIQYEMKWVMSLFMDEKVADQQHDNTWSAVETMLHFIFSALWVLPLYVISKSICSFWFVDVSDSVYRLLYGTPKAFPSISLALADLVYGIIFETLLLFQAYAVKLLPLEGINHLLYCIHVCLLYSLYACEYKWFNMGLDLRLRLQIIDNHWPYFFGFGLPLYLVNNIALSHYPMVAKACLFSIAFPFFIVSGTRASAPKRDSVVRLRLFEPSAYLCSFLFSASLRSAKSQCQDTLLS